MKFSSGAWLWADGVVPTLVRRVQEWRFDRDELTVWLLDRMGRDGADKFEGTVFELVLSSPMPGALRVRVRRHSRAVKGPVGFELDYSLKSGEVRFEDLPDELVYTSGSISARISKKRFELSFVNATSGIEITRMGALGFMRRSEPQGCHGGGAWGEPAGHGYMMQRLHLGVGECLYGFGEQFTPLVKNGQTVRIFNEDGGTISDQAYKTIPFYLSVGGASGSYGLLVNTPRAVEFEVATERVQQVQFSTEAEELDYYLFSGPEPREVMERYTRLSGRAPEIPAWSFGLWLSTSFTTQYDEKTVMEFVEGMASRGIPLSVFHFDCFWMKERHWCNFLWDRQAFPDPEGMIRRLKDRGLKVCLWINSYISGMSEIYQEAVAGGYLLRRKDGSVYQRDQWQPAMGIVDFTNPDAVKWYQGKLRRLLEMGVDTFKTDFGERIPVDDVVYHDGSDPALMHNYYPHLYNKAVFSLLETFHGKGKALVFARSATAGAQQFPVHWGGDCEATFESMAEDLRGGLSFCTSGPAFWSHDMGGFTGKADPAVYKRWAAFGLLSTHSRLHGSESYRVPWLFDEESVAVVRRFAELKNRLVPYFCSAARQASVRGTPVMRAMAFEFPDDPGCRHLDRQYMLGDDLLVVPIFRKDGVAEFYVPQDGSGGGGEWRDLLTDKVYQGGRWYSQVFDFLHLPVLIRPGGVVAMSDNTAAPDWKISEPLVLQINGTGLQGERRVSVVSTEGRLESGDSRSGEFILTRLAGSIQVEGDGKVSKVSVVLRGLAGRHPRGRETSEGYVVTWANVREPLVIPVE